jgi:predicted nuclease of restriction endonuclease-like (RecB) superfamily
MTKMKKNVIIKSEYIRFLNEIKARIVSARIQATRTLNKELMSLYWDIGKTIAARQESLGWGKSVVNQLSRDLTGEFDNAEGVSPHNLWRMRMFYLTYRNNEKVAQVVLQIPWGHNILIMQKIKNPKEREYYITSCIKFGWSRNVLLNQINAKAYALSLKQKHHNFSRTLPKHIREQAEESLKSVYNLDFLGITKPILERELEKRLIEKIKHFILELGSGFSFISSQHRLELNGSEYFIDLLFFNRKLKCLVAIELKTGQFEPEYAGKMDFYLHLLNEKVRLKDENPSVGIILCAQKNNVVVEYALRSIRNPVGIAEYRLTNKLPEPYKKILPSGKQLIEQIKEEIE